MSASLQPYGLQLARLLCPWDLPGKNTGVRCHFLLQGIFPIQILNPHLIMFSPLAGKFFTTSTTWKAHILTCIHDTWASICTPALDGPNQWWSLLLWLLEVCWHYKEHLVMKYQFYLPSRKHIFPPKALDSFCPAISHHVQNEQIVTGSCNHYYNHWDKILIMLSSFLRVIGSWIVFQKS